MRIDASTSLIQVDQSSRKAAPARVAATEQKVAESVDLDKAEKAKRVMQKYDLHNISYQEVGKMAGELLDFGVITGSQFIDMVGPPDGHLKLVDGETVFDKNPQAINFVKKDYLKNSELHLTYVEKYQASDISTVAHARELVNILHNLDALRSKA